MLFKIEDIIAGVLIFLVILMASTTAMFYSKTVTLRKEVTVLNTKLAASQDVLKDLADKSDVLRAAVKTAQAEAGKVRVVTQTRVQKIYQKATPEDCDGALDAVITQMQKTIKEGK